MRPALGKSRALDACLGWSAALPSPMMVESNSRSRDEVSRYPSLLILCFAIWLP